MATQHCATAVVTQMGYLRSYECSFLRIFHNINVGGMDWQGRWILGTAGKDLREFEWFELQIISVCRH